MALLQALSLFLAFLTAVAAAPALRGIDRYAGETTGRHIVTLKPGVSRDTLVNHISQRHAITHEWDAVLNGFAARFDEETLSELMSSPDVESISEDGIMHIMVTQPDAPWGLGRLSSSERLANQNASQLTFSYTYNETAAGAGVDIYIIGASLDFSTILELRVLNDTNIDTGIRASHSQFGGRARFAASFGGYPTVDGHGHGTHVAATAIGRQFGVAKAANVHAIRVLSDTGSGSTADIVSGMNYALLQARTSGKPSIVSMSLGGAANVAIDAAANALVAAGVHVTVAAGNSNVNAQNTSPARVQSLITVGASNIADAKANFSNYGPVVDVFAPGQNVISAWKDSDTATNSISGTSMATPHVAGLVAYLISLEGNVSPADMEAKLKSYSLKGVLTGLPTGTANVLVHNL
ncbi:hypothetical protein MD484_g4494, partial [Candolleomyces efflorescens]